MLRWLLKDKCKENEGWLHHTPNGRMYRQPRVSQRYYDIEWQQWSLPDRSDQKQHK